MKQKRNTRHYAKILAKRHGMSQQKVYDLLIFGMKNFCKIIERGEDIRIPMFAHVYFDKDYYLRSCNELSVSEKRYLEKHNEYVKELIRKNSHKFKQS